MAQPSPDEVSILLRAWSNGDQDALDKLMPIVHTELHRLAHRYMQRERAQDTLQTTALVNEAYLKLVNAQEIEWHDRAHFFAISAKIMRRILVDFARSRNYRKRGGGIEKVSLDKALNLLQASNPDLIKLDDALCALADLDPRAAQVVELRFFGGLNVDETAEVMRVSKDTVKRDWRLAKVWLLSQMKD